MDATQILLKVLDVANPLAGMVAEFVAGRMGLSDRTVDAVKQTISGMTGADQVKLQEIVSDLQKNLAQYGMQLQVTEMQEGTKQIESINKTLQTEAMGGSWWQRNHHAYECSFSVLLIGAVYFVLPLLRIPVPSIPETAFIMLGSILGVTAWQRGRANISVASKGPI